MKKCKRCQTLKPIEAYELVADPICAECKADQIRKANDWTLEKYGPAFQALAGTEEKKEKV